MSFMIILFIKILNCQKWCKKWLKMAWEIIKIVKNYKIINTSSVACFARLWWLCSLRSHRKSTLYSTHTHSRLNLWALKNGTMSQWCAPLCFKSYCANILSFILFFLHIFTFLKNFCAFFLNISMQNYAKKKTNKQTNKITKLT